MASRPLPWALPGTFRNRLGPLIFALTRCKDSGHHLQHQGRLAEARAYQTLRSATVLGVALVVAAALGSCAIEWVKTSQQTITVTGSAKKQIRSDLVIWRGWIAHQSGDMRVAYADLRASMAQLRAY